jgi:hypothetical protein
MSGLMRSLCSVMSYRSLENFPSTWNAGIDIVASTSVSSDTIR